MINERKFKDKGSNWGKWDLHVHTASSYDYKYKGADSDELLVKAWEEHAFSAVVISDHFKIDAERIKKLKQLTEKKITIFPGVELRTDKGGANIHVILIFDEGINIEELSQDFESIMIRQKSKPKLSDNDTIYWDYNDIIDFAKNHDGIISIHTGKKANGLDEVISNALPINMAIKTEYAETVDIFEGSKKQDEINYREYVFKKIKARPVIVCSDNHDPRDYSIKDYLWIKANPTFNGLKQAIIHPKERVFIGVEPPKVASLRKNPEKYISEISVKKKNNSRNIDTWFNYNICLNVGLTTVIGNKGSGKSAFADLLGYIGKSSNQQDFSFLSKQRFAKEDKKYNLDYEGEVIWVDGELNKASDFSLVREGQGVPLIKYLPQRYIEETCNSLDEKFQNEINSVIFSYVDQENRDNAKNLKELIDNKQVALLKRAEQIKTEISSINGEIINLERKRATSYKKQCKDNFDFWKNELKRHDANKPVPVIKPSDNDNKQNEINLIEKYNSNIHDNKELIRNNQNVIRDERVCIEELTNYKSDISFELERILELQNTGQQISEKYSIIPKIEIELINKLDGLNLRIDLANQLITEKSKLVTEQFDMKDYQASSDDEINADYDLAVSLHHKNYILEIQINRIKEILGRPQMLYQRYLDELNSWTEKRNKIYGDELTQSSLTYAQAEYNYLVDKLNEDLHELVNIRKTKIEELFNVLLEKKAILDEIYQPIESKLDVVLKNIKDKVRFKASISVDTEFSLNTLFYINQSIQSKFRGRSEGKEYVESLIRSFDISEFGGAYSLVDELLNAISIEEDKADQLVKKRQEYYDFITSLSYLNVGFSLKMGEKELEQLSPGEKGSVLLIFYLALDQEEKPLVIDQPEDNLDNQSVFDKLVPCVLEAKKNRQVILITHNPNLAIACDSELIIHSENTGNQIIYFEGPIEEQSIKEKIVDVLEGTMPAFDLRTSKYKGIHFSSNN
ncbi:hypothetical protein J3A84_06330 [Proteiniclasticum sp. SCR006]|uniref:ATPase AAA-type core domain-containing protein n=1 Tax=Proteiniclasticum aestuarii TaxID=2817862 RepID=A0A939KFN5_9CLOT|nr:hypothetical protein [Proteiniclasticum aestuarii]MBO1264642.1 hypothetical protein [Proteiniclasticum aestuarii]